MEDNTTKGIDNFNPVFIESSKYDRDLKLLESLNPSVPCKKDRHQLLSLAVTYDFKGVITNENFHQIRGEAMAEIYHRLRLLSGIVVDKQRERDPGSRVKIPKMSREDDSLKDKWAVGKKVKGK